MGREREMFKGIPTNGVRSVEGELLPATPAKVRELRTRPRQTQGRGPPLPALKFEPKHKDKPRGLSRAGMGRPKGSRNHLTMEVKEVIAQCFKDVGGAKAFAAWARQNRTDFYRLYAKLLPIQLQTKDTKEIIISISNDEAGL